MSVDVGDAVPSEVVTHKGFPGTYGADVAALGPWGSRFAPLEPDEETRAWLTAHARPHGAFRTWLVAQLSKVMSTYDAHGLTGSYPMHLLSTAQWRALVGEGPGRALLDVGAGAGYVTAYAAPLFAHVTCTETSSRLAKRLRARRYEVYEQDIGERPLTNARTFDVITCLNVLDRTPYPRRLLARLIDMCGPSTRLVIALPLPVSAHVHVAGATVAPFERLPFRARIWEAAVQELSEELFIPSGLTIERIARVPYLSHGDTGADLYVLDDALWVMRRAEPS